MEIFHGKRFKSFLEESIKEKKDLEQSYQESVRQTKERKLKEKAELEKSQDNKEKTLP